MSELALERIRENKRTQAKRLNLARCGLTVLPDELFECVWLEELILSNRIWDYEKDDWVLPHGKGSFNLIHHVSPKFKRLKHLRSLYLGGSAVHNKSTDQWPISNISPLQLLNNLETLDLKSTLIQDISPLKSCKNLKNLDLRNTPVIDLSVLGSLPSLEIIDLSGTEVSDITALQSLSYLQKLYLTGTKISNIISLEKLTSLKILDLAQTQISDISSIQELKSLESINLSRTEVSDFTPFRELSQLTFLFLNSCDITDISIIKSLNKIQVLDLTNTNISDVSHLENLQHLHTLSLNQTQVCDISSLSSLISLKIVHLADTKVSDISSIKNLTSIREISLSRTNVSDITPIQSLNNLQTLYLNQTHVNDISPITSIKSLRLLSIRSIEIDDISPILTLLKRGLSISWNRFSQEFGITLFNNSFPRIPHEITQKGPEVIINYFKELANEEQTVYEAKLLIVGEAGTGKTTLSRKVRNCEADMPKEAEESTRGIDIVTHIWEQEDQPNFIMKIWDFGGQDVYHGIHQIFLSKRSLYVLVLDGRIEENPHYWLQAQELFGGDSPLLVLLNQKGTIRQNVAVRELQTDYNNLREYLSINLKEDTEDVRRLGSTVEHYIRNLPHLQKGEKLPAKWVRIRKKVEELSKEENFIYLRDFQKICKEEEIAEKERQLFLSDYLHDLGVLLHFSKEPQLRDILFLNNQWTTDAIYKVLDQTKAQEPPGYFTRKDLETIWSDESYEHVFEKLLALMERFDLCYQVPGQDVFIVPQLLPSDKPEGYQWEKENDLELRYRYDFLPKGIVPRLIVRLHALLQNQAQVWKRGAVFQKGEAIAEVIENFRDEYIHIRVKGHNRRRLLTIIAHQMDEINKTFQFSEKMGVNQLIPCNYSNCQCGKAFYFQLDRLLAAEKANVPELQCQNSFKMVSVQELIQGTFTKGTGLWDYQNPPYISEFEYIDELLKEGYIKEALTQLKDVVKLTPLNRSVDQLIGQYALLQQEISKGIITEEARIVASNKMLESTLNIFTDVKEGNYDVDRLQYAVVKPPLPDPIHHIRIQPIHITVHGNYVQGDAQNVASSQSGDASIDQSQTQTDQSIHLHIDKLQALLQAGQELGEFSADDAEEITYILDDLKEEKEPESPREKKRWKKFLGRIRDFAGKRIEKGADTMVSEGVKEWLKEGGMEILNGFIQTL